MDIIWSLQQKTHQKHVTCEVVEREGRNRKMVEEELLKKTLKSKTWEEWNTGIINLAKKACGITNRHKEKKST